MKEASILIKKVKNHNVPIVSQQLHEQETLFTTMLICYKELIINEKIMDFLRIKAIGFCYAHEGIKYKHMMLL